MLSSGLPEQRTRSDLFLGAITDLPSRFVHQLLLHRLAGRTSYSLSNMGPDSALHNYDAVRGGNCLNIFWTSRSSFFVFFSGLPDRSLLDVPRQINCLELPSNMLTRSVPTL